MIEILEVFYTFFEVMAFGFSMSKFEDSSVEKNSKVWNNLKFGRSNFDRDFPFFEWNLVKTILRLCQTQRCIKFNARFGCPKKVCSIDSFSLPESFWQVLATDSICSDCLPIGRRLPSVRHCTLSECLANSLRLPNWQATLTSQLESSKQENKILSIQNSTGDRLKSIRPFLLAYQC